MSSSQETVKTGTGRPPLFSGLFRRDGSLAIRWRKIAIGGTVEHLAKTAEARTMAGAVPGFFCRIPVNDAAKVAAYRRAFVQRTFFVPVNRDFRQAAAHDCAAILGDLVHRRNIARRDPVRILSGHVDCLL